jgi:uncharacterized membrane protein
MPLAIPYIVTLVVFVVIDLIWLGYIAKGFYRAQLGSLMAEPMNLPAAVVFYLIYAGGLVFFAVQPGLIQGGWQRGLMLGAILGFVAYATYDLSNLATLRGWPLPLTVVDIVWGSALSAMTAAIAIIISSRIAN